VFFAFVLLWVMACYITAIGYIFFVADTTIHLHLLENLALPNLEEDLEQAEPSLVTNIILDEM